MAHGYDKTACQSSNRWERPLAWKFEFIHMSKLRDALNRPTH